MEIAPTANATQFCIAHHYDVMAALDRDVHDNVQLASTEVDLAIYLMNRIPKRLFLPCCGTGRHIPRLLERGVREIVGVDLSQQCLAKARQCFARDRRVTLIEANLETWRIRNEFDAVIFLGNSFGDQIDPLKLTRMTAGILRPLQHEGAIVMDYIGKNYFYRLGQSTIWDATFQNTPARDRRTPRYDSTRRIMTIDVDVTNAATGSLLWKGAYQKRILDDNAVRAHFLNLGVRMQRHGLARELNTDYYGDCSSELGMLACSAWWVGTKI